MPSTKGLAVIQERQLHSLVAEAQFHVISTHDIALYLCPSNTYMQAFFIFMLLAKSIWSLYCISESSLLWNTDDSEAQ